MLCHKIAVFVCSSFGVGKDSVCLFPCPFNHTAFYSLIWSLAHLTITLRIRVFFENYLECDDLFTYLKPR